jgi:hypothetical protein
MAEVVVEKNLWAHSCCTHEELEKAIADEDIKFIESDIIISSSTGKWLKKLKSTYFEMSQKMFKNNKNNMKILIPLIPSDDSLRTPCDGK